jgi:uncharacterized protein (DUF1684 family)
MRAIVLVLVFAAFSATAQNNYQDSLVAFQENYKKELFEIIKSDTAFVRFYAPDAHYRIRARVEFLSAQPFFGMNTSGPRKLKARRFAKVSFTLDGKAYALYAYQLGFLLDAEKSKDGFFIPFTDEGSGASTYEGGRYLDFKMSDIVDKTLVIDFNKAYNPYCAFTSGYDCPIPPSENSLSVGIAAGEKKFAKAH